MSNRFEKQRGGFLDMAVSVRKRAKSFLDEVDKVIEWRPIEKFLKKKLRRNKDAIGNPAYPPLSMFKGKRQIGFVQAMFWEMGKV